MSTYSNTSPTEKMTPISGFQFNVYTTPENGLDWLPEGKVGFTNVSGLGNSTEAIEYKEGNDLYGDMLPGRSRGSGEVVLSRGLDKAMHLISWRNAILERSALPTEEARADVYIDIYDRQGVENVAESEVGALLVQRWVIRKAWPKDYAIDDLDSRGGTEINVQRCTLAHYGVPELLYQV